MRPSPAFAVAIASAGVIGSANPDPYRHATMSVLPGIEIDAHEDENA
jgi:hypothetical protein